MMPPGYIGRVKTLLVYGHRQLHCFIPKDLGYHGYGAMTDMVMKKRIGVVPTLEYNIVKIPSPALFSQVTALVWSAQSNFIHKY